MASLPFNRICNPVVFRYSGRLQICRYENCPYENGTLQVQKIANLPVQNTLSVTISAAVTAFRGIFVFLPSRHTGNLYNCISKESGYYEKEKD